MSIKEAGKRASSELLKGKVPHPCVVPENTIRESRVELVIDFMRASLQRRISLTELANVVDLSPSHLSLLFKTQTGLSPGEYFRRLRMERARHLLVTGLLSIKQIMVVVGYSNRSNFLRHFRRYFDLVPSEYRRRARGGHLSQTDR